MRTDSRYIIMHTSYVYSCPNDPIMYRYLFSHSCVPKFLCTAMHTHVDTRGSEYVYARTHTYARAHRRCRRAQVPRRTEPRPSAPAAVARRRPKAAHTWYNEVSDTVFHAPMFALNLVVPENACEPNRTRSTPPAERARTFRRGYTCAEAHAEARAHTRTHTCASMARRHASQIRSSRYIYISECIYI